VKYSHYNPALPIKPINGPTAKGLKEIPATAPTSAPVRCISVRDEALGVKTFEFALPPTQILPAVSTLKAGQYATFEADVPTAEGGNATQTVVRTWTISSHPLQMAASGSFTITVKREGKVSAWLHETMRPGSKADPRFRCIGFGGTFVPHPVPAAKAPSISGANGTCKAGALLLAGGIGITPLRSILCDLLGPACGHDSVASEQAPRCLDHIALIYSVRDPREAAFLPELAAFAAKSGSSGSGGEGAHCKTSMSVILTVTGSQVKQAANGDHSSEQPQDWAVQQARGRLSTQVVQQYVLGPLGAESLADKGWVWQVYMCGPPGYMAAAEASLQELGMPPNRIYQESFKF
jgi:ferredoxin-NADP reductase